MFFSKEIQVKRNVKYLLHIEKNWRPQNNSKSKFLGKNIWRNALDLKSKKTQGIFGETFILALLASAVFRLQKRV